MCNLCSGNRKKVQFQLHFSSVTVSPLCLSHVCLPSLTFFDESTGETWEGSSDSPESPDQLGVLQQTGVDWQPELALCHGQLAVFERVVGDGNPQGSEQQSGAGKSIQIALNGQRGNTHVS